MGNGKTIYENRLKDGVRPGRGDRLAAGAGRTARWRYSRWTGRGRCHHRLQPGRQRGGPGAAKRRAMSGGLNIRLWWHTARRNCGVEGESHLYADDFSRLGCQPTGPLV